MSNGGGGGASLQLSTVLCGPNGYMCAQRHVHAHTAHLGEFCDGPRVHSGHLHIALARPDSLQNSTGPQDQLESHKDTLLRAGDSHSTREPMAGAATHIPGSFGVRNAGESDVTRGSHLSGGPAQPGPLLDEQVALKRKRHDDISESTQGAESVADEPAWPNMAVA